MVQVLREVESHSFAPKIELAWTGADGEEHVFRGIIRSDTCRTHTKQIEGSSCSESYFRSCYSWMF